MSGSPPPAPPRVPWARSPPHPAPGNPLIGPGHDGLGNSMTGPGHDGLTRATSRSLVGRASHGTLAPRDREARKALGLAAFEVVPDDPRFKPGPLRLRPRDMGELIHYDFDQFDVVPAGRVAKGSRTQLTQAEFEGLAHFWVEMSNGHGLEVNGTPADKTAFKRMLRQAVADSPVFRQLLTTIGNDRDPNHQVVVNLGRNQQNALIDIFHSKEVDLADLEKIPIHPDQQHPNRRTQAQSILHVLAERRSAVTSSDPTLFKPAHRAAREAENQYRRERNQAAILSDDSKREGAEWEETLIWRYAGRNNNLERWLFSEHQLVDVNYPPQPKPK